MTGLKGKEKFLFPFLAVISALIPILYPTILNGGFFHLGDDFDNQMLPFLFNFRDAFENGFNTYMWNFDLGTPMVYAYGYYGLGSIFFYPVFLVPRALLPYAISVIFLLKYVLAAYTAFFFIKKFTKSPEAAIPGAIIYAFSGLQSTNLSFYIFHDVTALFPLMLLATEELIEAVEENEDRRKLIRKGVFFSLAVCINCATNYVFFVQSVVAIIIYFLFRIRREIKVFVLGFLDAVGFGVLGVGLSGIIFIPSIMYMLGNARSGGGISESLYLYDYKHVLYILKGFLFPGDCMLDETALMIHEWSSTSAYLPFVGLIPVLAYLFKKRDFLTRLTIFLVIISFIPVGNGAFLAFMIVYHRWWYFLILIMALESSLVLESIEEYDLRIPALLQAVLTLAVAALIWLYREEGESLLFHKARLVMQVVFVLACTTAVVALTRRMRVTGGVKPSDMKIELGSSPRKVQKVMLIGIVICSMVTFLFAEYLYRKATPVKPVEYENSYLAMQQVPEIEDNYRYRNYVNPLIMYGMSSNITGLSSYSSTTSNSTVEFDELFDYYDVSRRINKNFFPGVPELLGGKYLIRTDNFVEERYPEPVLQKIDGAVPLSSFKVGDRNWNVYELDACPIGYAVDRVISDSEFRTLTINRRGIALLYAPVVSDDIAKEIAETGILKAGASETAGEGIQISPLTAEEVDAIIEESPDHTGGDALYNNPCIEELTALNSAGSVKSFVKTKKGYTIETDYDNDVLIYLTLPYDEGWEIGLDGTDAEIKPISSGGMTLIPVPAGRHELVATYHLPWLKAGIIATILSFLTLAYMIAGTEITLVKKRKLYE